MSDRLNPNILFGNGPAQERLAQLLAAIEASEVAVRQSASGQQRAFLLEIIRAIDIIGYFRNFAPDYPLSDLPAYLEVCWMGLNRALSLFLPGGMTGPGVVWARTNADRSR